MPAFMQHSGTNADPLVGALLAGTPGITIVPGSVTLNASAPTAIGYYDGSLADLGIGAGIIMTSGTMPGTTNTDTAYGTSNGAAGSALIDAVINPVFNTHSHDASTLSFQFEVTDTEASSISFDLVFGSDEFPEWVDQYVDSAVVYVNGVNHALFDHDPLHPLSVISQNLSAGYFNDNGTGALPIEYDGVSNKLTIVAPILKGQVNTITIAISDTGDHILDSGIILSSLTAGNLPGSGVVITQPGNETENDDYCIGSSLSEVFNLKGGDDTAFGAGGDDIMAGGAGMDDLDGGSGDDALSGGADDDVLDGGSGDDTASYADNSTDYSIAHDAASNSYTVKALAVGSTEGTDSLTHIEKLSFADGLFALTADGLTAVTGGTGGTTNTPGAISIAGVAAESQTLTAFVSDVDGIAGPVSYVWQQSTNGGADWTDLGETSDSYVVTADDSGAKLRVLANYADGLGLAEALTSDAKSVTAGTVGDLQITLLQIDAPDGATVASPLTTLVLRAIELGLTPNNAEAMVQSVLQLTGGPNLLQYDAYGALIADPGDALALACLGRMLQVTILTSLNDDDTAEGLVVKMIEAWQSGQTLDLSDADVLGDIIGVAPVLGTDGKYPEPLNEIEDRCASIQGIVDDGDGLASLEIEWSDFASVQETIYVGSIDGLITPVNQAPTGFATGTLAGNAGEALTISLAALLAGFADPEGGALIVSDLTADQPGDLVQNPDGSWTFTPVAAGPVEFSYLVWDADGLSIGGSKVMIVAAVEVTNTTPAAVDDTALTGIDMPVTINVLGNDTDADAGDTLVVAAITTAPVTGSATVAADQSLTYTPLPRWFGTDSFSYEVKDAAGLTDIAVVTVTVAGPAGLTAGPVTLDVTDTKPWAGWFDIFNTGGDRINRTTLYDDGRILEVAYEDGLKLSQLMNDTADQFSWSSITKTYDSAGQVSGIVAFYDNGVRIDTLFSAGLPTQAVKSDLANAFDWSETTITRDPSGQITSTTTLYDGGNVKSVAFVNGIRSSADETDGSDSFIWSEKHQTFDAAGQLAESVIIYDDGRLSETFLVDGVRASAVLTDVNDVYHWAVKDLVYDSEGTLIDVIVTPDSVLAVV